MLYKLRQLIWSNIQIKSEVFKTSPFPFINQLQISHHLQPIYICLTITVALPPISCLQQ